ncbi:MAG: D-alanine--D-alanine ligase [Bacteroidetes bacterium]|nr:MAG: D-alanine--D-alanine ligase [Bacteroidota bacterium]
MLRIGIFFGGFSREREISFAGGRTIYDNLNKSLFEPIPIFVDSFGNFVLLEWRYIYKGSIRDFYPSVDSIPESPNEFQIYAESLGNLGIEEQHELISKIGTKLSIKEIQDQIDFAFLALHGVWGEDGEIQQLLEDVNIPYSGSGIEASKLGMNKVLQKEEFEKKGFLSPKYITISRDEWIVGNQEGIYKGVQTELPSSIVTKAANQGSSIGISILKEPTLAEFKEAINKCLFIHKVSSDGWQRLDKEEQVRFVRDLVDIRSGIGLPVKVEKRTIYHPEELLSFIDDHFTSQSSDIELASIHDESDVIIEEFIDGKEFSSIVILNENDEPLALPPTGIEKGGEFFDYRSKYLPGLSRKVTPIDLPEEQIENIRTETEKMFKSFGFNVYARIDGFITSDGTIYLNDPNTTSGMLPSSFFFHQAAEIGLNPSQFITYIIRTSILERSKTWEDKDLLQNLLDKLDESIKEFKSHLSDKLSIAVIMGGYSSERHISVESGRNIYEKLASSVKYEPIPVFLIGDSNRYEMHQVPINVMLKDHADDIKEKVLNYQEHPIITKIKDEAKGITDVYGSQSSIDKPHKIDFLELAELADGVFIALHGRPGEDGNIQKKLIEIGLPFNGSYPESASITIDKFRTNEILKDNGFIVAKNLIVIKEDWQADDKPILERINNDINYPLIAKPIDDGCSTSVKKINSPEELKLFAQLLFRESTKLPEEAANKLNIKLNEEIPQKDSFLIEQLIDRANADHFLEITGGMLTHLNGKSSEIKYEMFEPSEALSDAVILSLEEKFLAGEGQNITPARYSTDKSTNAEISDKVRSQLESVAKLLNIEGYSRIDAFVRVHHNNDPEVIFIEVNSLPGMTPATCIFHQCALNGYKPYEFIDEILEFGFKRKQLTDNA